MEFKYTCITCRVAFKDADIQRLHYKTDWHRYNLKRKVAELPSVTAEDFAQKVLLQREKDESARENSVHCNVCRKSFSSQNAYENHLNSKKHKDFLLEFTKDPQLNGNLSPDKEESHDDDSEVEEVDSDEWDEDAENPIVNNNCLFCSHHSRNMVKNLKHMTVKHSFFVPDADFVTDLRGLLMFLGEKVTVGFMCLWCNDRGKTFYSPDAAKQHMQDKGHCKMLHEGEALAEYAEFYDYSSSYPDQQTDKDEEVDVPVIDDSDYQLVLPSGATIGHRSLMQYYKQRLKPEETIVPQRKKLNKVLAQYRALGWTGTQKEQAERKARDIHYMQRIQAKSFTKLGVHNNKLQKFFRVQVNF